MLERLKELFKGEDQSRVVVVDADDLEKLAEVTGYPIEHIERFSKMDSGEIPPPRIISRIDEEGPDIQFIEDPDNITDNDI